MRKAMLWAVLLGGVLLSGCSLFGPPGAQLLYEERFSQADGNKWVVGDYTSFRLWIAGGKYHLECQPDHSGTVNSSDAGQFDDFELKADVEHISGADNKSAAGLIFRFVDWDNYYEFYVSPVGTFRVRKIAGGTWTNLTDQFDGDDAIHTGPGTNRLAVVANGSNLVFSINGQQVFQTTDASHPAGRIGVKGFSWPDSTMHVAFDNIEVWSIP